MSIIQQLQHIGLTQNEARVYQFLLEQGFSSPPEVAKGTKIARTNCYNILQSLAQKGLVQQQKQGKRKAYIANDPEALFQRVREQKDRIEELLPDLRGLYAQHQNKPTIRFFNGFEEVQEIYYMTLTSQEVFGIGSTNELARRHNDFYTRWLKEVKKKNIVFHDILSYPSGESAAPEMKELLRGLYDFKLMPKEYEDFPTDLLLWENNIALLSFEEPVFGTVLTNPTLAKTFRLLFRALWEHVPDRQFVQSGK